MYITLDAREDIESGGMGGGGGESLITDAWSQIWVLYKSGKCFLNTETCLKPYLLANIGLHISWYGVTNSVDCDKALKAE